MTNTTSDWINHRLPEEGDGDNQGYVYVKLSPKDDTYATIHWSYVGHKANWKHTKYWEKPIELPGIKGQWINGSSILPDAISGFKSKTVQVLSDDCKTINTMYIEPLRAPKIWRPFFIDDNRPLVLAETETIETIKLPGKEGEWISGSEILPQKYHGDTDGEVQVKVKEYKFTYKKWDFVTKQDIWRPRPHIDPRPD
jgi:hypothetical protein